MSDSNSDPYEQRLEAEEKTEPEIQASWKRTIGASIFGLVSAGYIFNAAKSTVPYILSTTSSVDLETAQSEYDSFGLLRFAVLIIAVFADAVSARFLAKRRGILAGILANSVYNKTSPVVIL